MKIFSGIEEEFTDEEKTNLQNIIDDCDEAFEISAQQHCRYQTISAYVDYLVDIKGLRMVEVEQHVSFVVSQVIEKYNCGSTKFMKTVNQFIIKKFRPSNNLKALACDIGKKLGTINTEFTTPKVRDAIESLGSFPKKEITADNEGYKIGLMYVEKYVTPMIQSCFPEEFAKYLSK